MNKRSAYILYLFLAFMTLLGFSYQYIPFGEAQSRGIVENRALNEASGITASLVNPGLLWAHNDSGDAARIFLMDDSARNKAVYYLEGVKARDWEEIGFMKSRGQRFLLIGDIGDNAGNQPFVTIHRVKEPLFKGKPFYIDTIPEEDILSYTLQYSDGPRDAEALFYDEIDDKLYVISKREFEVGLYSTQLDELAKDTLVLNKESSLPFTFVTAAAISHDGRELLVKNLVSVFYWKRQAAESIPSLLKKDAIKLPYKPEIQGEAISFALDGSGYFTLSEEPFGFKADLRYYPRL